MASLSVTNRWLVNYKPRPQAALNLFCLPYAGGGPHAYATWADALPASINLYAVQFPGRGTRVLEKPFADLETLLGELTRAFLPHLHKPFALFGHSMGALVAFELARRFQHEHALSPTHLFVSGRGGPRRADEEPSLSHLPEDELISELKRFNGAPPEVLDNAELMQMMMPAIRADFMLCENYVYTARGKLNCPISAFGGVQDVDVPREGLDEWREETHGSFSLRMIPGGHFFLHTSKWAVLEGVVRALAAYAR